MKKFSLFFSTLILLLLTILPAFSDALASGNRLFFLHHSTGRNVIVEGDIRGQLATINKDNESELVFWDHDYNYIGLKDPAGSELGYGFSVPDDNTDPDGLYKLWTTKNSARDSILSRFDVIAFKSCYPASEIETDAELEQYKTWYQEMLSVFLQYPEKTFVVMSQPPLHRFSGTNTAESDRARAFADWLSGTFVAGHANVVCFNLFAILAEPDDGSDYRNMLKYEYERDHVESDSHPNVVANETVAPLFISFLSDLVLDLPTSVENSPLPLALEQNVPNPFNPSTTLKFSLERRMTAEMTIFDVRGRQVRRFPASVLDEGNHSIVWNGTEDDGKSAPSGLYFYRLATEDGAVTRKMILSK